MFFIEIIIIVTAANVYVIILLIHKTEGLGFFLFFHLILSAVLWSSTTVITLTLQRRKLSQREVKWRAQGHTAIKCQPWDFIQCCCLNISAALSRFGFPAVLHCCFHNVWKPWKGSVQSQFLPLSPCCVIGKMSTVIVSTYLIGWLWELNEIIQVKCLAYVWHMVSISQMLAITSIIII